jgi:CRP-like cAMP-binding protein
MLREIAMISEEITVEADHWVHKEGDPALHLYLVLEGGVSITMSLKLNGSGEHTEKLSPIGMGEVFGWSSLVKPHFYKFGAQATRKTKLVVIDAVALLELLEDNPQYGYYIMKNITEVIGERLEFKCTQLLSMVV